MELIILAGPNGSGKSSITWSSLRDRFSGFEILDPDAVARRENISHIGAARIVLERTNELLSSGDTFVVETTFSGKRETRLIDDAIDRGYFVEMHFVCAGDPEINVARVAKRVRLGGHDVPKIDIRRRYTRSLQNLAAVFSKIESLYLYDSRVNNATRNFASYSYGQRQYLLDPPSWATALPPIKRDIEISGMTLPGDKDWPKRE